MDLLITMFVVLCVGTVKVIKNLKLDRAPILEADGSLNRIGDERPIGNNLMLDIDRVQGLTDFNAILSLARQVLSQLS